MDLWIRRFFQPPVLADENLAHQAKQMNIILWIDIAFFLVLCLVSVTTTSFQLPPLIVASILIDVLSSLVLKLRVHQGHILQSGYFFLSYKVLFLTVSLIVLRSTDLPLMGAYILIVVAAGLLINKRWLVVITACTAVAISTLLFAGLSILSYLVLLVFIVITAIITYLAQQNIISTLVRTQQDLAEKVRTEEDLAKTRDTLEREVAARTAELFAANESLINEIAERSQVEEALRRSMEELLTFMDVTPGVVFLFREDGKMIRWNRQFSDATGYRVDELLSMNAMDFIYEEDRPVAMAMVEKAMEEGQADAEVRVCSKNGQVALYFTAGARLMDDTGVRFFAGVGVDITSLFATEQALRESEERYRNLMEAIPDIVLVSDFDGRLLYTTPSLERHTGLSYPDLQSTSQNNVVYIPDETDNMQQAIQEFIQSDLPYSDTIENRLLGKDNQPHWYSSILSRVQFQGQPALQVISRDITEKKQAEAELYRSQERLRALLDATTDVTFLMATDGTFLAMNEAAARTYGQSSAELVGKSGFDPLPEEIAKSRWELFSQVIRSRRPLRFEDYGLAGWADNSLFPVFSADGKVEAVAVFSRDITEQKLAEEALRESEERYALAARGANDGLWDLNLRTGQIYLSPRWKSMLGFQEEESREQVEDWLTQVHPEDRDLVRSRLDAHLQGKMPHYECEFRLLHKDGSYRWALTRGLAVRDEHGVAYRAAGSMTDITDSKRIEAQLLHDAFHDALTGLPNRALLADRLEQAIRRQKRYHDYGYALLYLDLDRFKDINDSHGHPAGDRLLIAAAQRMQTCMREADTLARLGGDEFVILQTEVHDASDAISLAERLQEELIRPFAMEGLDLAHTSASIGIVLGEESHMRAEDILRDADIAMYQAKAQGKARYQLFDSSMRNQVLARVRLETELRQAIKLHELEVYYHPIISLKNRRFTGFEALVRWRHPVRGIISPAEFIPLAEDSLLVIPLDLLVLAEACRQVKEWQELSGYPIKISVNLSGRHFPQADLVDTIQKILKDTGLGATDLIVEITESAVMENFELATITLRGLQQLGVRVEFDDFGKGQSSLTYLMELPVNTLKLDSSFIHQIASDTRTAEIVRTVVRLGHNIGLDVVAEGVETAEQLSGLQAMGCDFAQGYLFSKPLDRVAAAKWMQEQWSWTRPGDAQKDSSSRPEIIPE
jgi:diguanylate cyclase (GGDEF)-like protein/PAS domain S-box-containing protein